MDQQAFNPNNTLGALSIGVTISVFLYGVLFMQTYVYHKTFPNDSPRLKALVAFVVSMETVHLLCITHSIYSLTITNYGNPASLVRPPNTVIVAVIFSGMIGSLIQGFFAGRIKVVSEKWVVSVICWSMCLARLTLSLIIAVKAFQMTSLTQFSHDTKGVLTATLVVSAALDISISAGLCYYLRAKRNTSHMKTAKTIDQIITWTIQTGLANSITGLVELICFVLMPNNFIWLAIFMFLARMYSNSLLASLNARTILRSTLYAEPQQSSDNSTYHGNTDPGARKPVHIKMTKMTESTTETMLNVNMDRKDIVMAV
ncbi:hypothetical protein BJ165DRAFT_1508163 [Panaeolus papilionaceus]|nr:hypothetical protein BJ165DRAFT_1508163 [Panaeolus papilionaceus]